MWLGRNRYFPRLVQMVPAVQAAPCYAVCGWQGLREFRVWRAALRRLRLRIAPRENAAPCFVQLVRLRECGLWHAARAALRRLQLCIIPCGRDVPALCGALWSAVLRPAGLCCQGKITTVGTEVLLYNFWGNATSSIRGLSM